MESLSIPESVYPQKCGIGIFSPALDQHGNSLAGMSLLQDVVDQLVV